MPKRTLTISRGPSLVILNGAWMRPWKDGRNRNTLTFYGHYEDKREDGSVEDGSVTIAVDGLTHQNDKNGSEVHIEGILTELDGAPVEERKLSFYYHTRRHIAHILI